jgi:hypothetical protein
VAHAGSNALTHVDIPARLGWSGKRQGCSRGRSDDKCLED